MVWLIRDEATVGQTCLMYGSMLPDEARELAREFGIKIRKIKTPHSLTAEQVKNWKAKNLPTPGAGGLLD